MTPNKVLIIQTAFLGDVILATGLIEQIIHHNPATQIDFLLKKGNESILSHNPHIAEVLILNKQQRISNILSLLKKIRNKKYDLVVNLHRFASSGILAGLSGAKQIIGFDKNPFSFLYTKRYKHQIGSGGQHEVDRNSLLLESIYGTKRRLPKMYYSTLEDEQTQPLKSNKYICLAPGSVWFTKRYPKNRWISLINDLHKDFYIYLLGAPGEFELCEEIKTQSSHNNIVNLAGKLSITASASLMKDATMNLVNDSGPLHIASAVNAPVTAVFCSTIPAFGFGPLSENSSILETTEKLSCRPCNLHGKVACPLGHFNCANTINHHNIVQKINKSLI